MEALTKLLNRLRFDNEDDTREAEVEDKRMHVTTKNDDIKLQARIRSSTTYSRVWKANKRRYSPPEQWDSTHQKEKIPSHRSEMSIKEFMKENHSSGIEDIVESKITSIGNRLSEEMQTFKQSAVLSWRRLKRKRRRRASEAFYRNKYSTPKRHTRRQTSPCLQLPSQALESDSENSIFDIVKRNISPLLNMVQSASGTDQMDLAGQDSSRTVKTINNKYEAHRRRSKTVSTFRRQNYSKHSIV